jgi:hypothetical protein
MVTKSSSLLGVKVWVILSIHGQVAGEGEENLERTVEERRMNTNCSFKSTAATGAVNHPTNVPFLSFPSGREAHGSHGGRVCSLNLCGGSYPYPNFPSQIIFMRQGLTV